MTVDNVLAILTHAKDLGLSAEVFIRHDFIILFNYPFIYKMDAEYLYKAVPNNEWIKCPLNIIEGIRLFEP